eukprot:3369406-Pyramimonas_sp.AAC.1
MGFGCSCSCARLLLSSLLSILPRPPDLPLRGSNPILSAFSILSCSSSASHRCLALPTCAAALGAC